jgi:SAM-dependent methyltransferase
MAYAAKRKRGAVMFQKILLAPDHAAGACANPTLCGRPADCDLRGAGIVSRTEEYERLNRMRRAIVNPFASRGAVTGYEAWYGTRGRRADRLEKALLKRLLARFPQGSSLLEVGCGTGHFTRWLEGPGSKTAALDLSLPMLAEASRLGSWRCLQGDALALPFSMDSFDLAAMITTLEFVADPVRALGEALRVARQGLLLGVLNRQSLLGWRLKKKGGTIWGAARFFTPAELTRMVRQAAAGRQVDIVWRTTLWPGYPGALPLPWGGFIGMAVVLSERRRR